MVDLLVTGGSGMVGQAIKRQLPKDVEAVFVGSGDFNLLRPARARKMMAQYRPKQVIHLAAKVGGVKANTEQVCDFYYENMMINTNVLHGAHMENIQNVISLLSTCVYPDAKYITYPLTPDQLHNGPPHESNYGYAYAKRMLEVQSRTYREQHGRNYVCAIPNNIYGPGDNFDLEQAHVIPAIIRKVYEAKHYGNTATLWGDGSPLREFTYVDDIAICLLKMAGFFVYEGCEKYDGLEPVNIGNTEEHTILAAFGMIAQELNMDQSTKIEWDETEPNGQLRKPSSAVAIPHRYKPLEEGIKLTCEWFEQNYPNVRGVI